MRPLAILCLLLCASVFGAEIPLRLNGPEGGSDPVPAGGGVPFPKGALKSVDNVRLLDGAKKEIPSQAAKLAVWPDGSIKWVLITAIVAPKTTSDLTLEYGDNVQRAPVSNGVVAAMDGDNVKVSGGGIAALIKKDGAGCIDQLSIGGNAVISAGKPAALKIDTLRVAERIGEALPVNHFLCRDPNAKVNNGKVQIESLSVESPGPICAIVLIRGVVLLADFGATLPQEVKDREAAGRLPFSMRVSFYKGLSTVTGQHQIIFSGEPDCDFITRWGIELPGLAGASGLITLEPGINLIQTGDKTDVAKEQSRVCWAPLSQGFALIRNGWQNRPSAITQKNGSACIDFWPSEAGVFDLRRYSREWAVGESGDPKKPQDMERFAKYAARGLAKSHEFVIDFSALAGKETVPAKVQSLASRTLLVAQPAWYASTNALGLLPPEQTSGDFAEIDAATRRRLDYHIFSQDLFNWYGKLTYGFWQYKYGGMHRNDRWDCDYGRWGWSLNDGAGRVGQALMQQFIRTLDRRYFDAGEAFGRIAFDTNMVHTQQHLENCGGWWTAIGCSHRHNVQPFGCPYVGMRGSHPVAQRMLWLLTGDGVIGDGLDLVAGTAAAYAEGAGGRLCNSGGSDGQGSAANALLWKYESTGDKKYLSEVKTVIDASKLLPPAKIGDLGYGPGFGLYNAAAEYALLTGDAEFNKRLVDTAQMAVKAENALELLSVIAIAAHVSNDESLKTQLAGLMAKIAKASSNGIEDQPSDSWPGHGGWKTPETSVNTIRDLPMAMAVLAKAAPASAWPKAQPLARPIPAQAPADWFKPGGLQQPAEKVPSAAELLKAKGGSGGTEITAGTAKFSLKENLIDAMEINGAKPLAAPVCAYVQLSSGGNDKPAEIKTMKTAAWQMGNGGGTSTVEGTSFAVTSRQSTVDGTPALRLEIACKPSAGDVASWGLYVPLKLGSNAHALQTTAPGRFRLERCRLDQNDERIANWQTSEYHFGEGAVLWPKWRESGIEMGPGNSYRIWRANRRDVTPTVCDQGIGGGNWFDITDRGTTPKWGLTARVMSSSANARAAIRINLETGIMEIQFHSTNAQPIAAKDAAAGLSATVELILHDGWRAPLSKPELSAEQYEKFIDDLNYNENYGLCALRFALSVTHKVQGREWMEKIRDLGIEPREILYGMQYGNALSEHAKKLGVTFDAARPEQSIQAIIDHYRKK